MAVPVNLSYWSHGLNVCLSWDVNPDITQTRASDFPTAASILLLFPVWPNCTQENWGPERRGERPPIPGGKSAPEPGSCLPVQPFHCAEQPCWWGLSVYVNWKPLVLNHRPDLQRNRPEVVTEAGGQSHLGQCWPQAKSANNPFLASCVSHTEPFGASFKKKKFNIYLFDCSRS